MLSNITPKSGPWSSIPWATLANPLAAAEDAMARLDERLRTSPIREGWVERTHFADACACLWLAGELVHLEDLVLHDAGMDVRAPTHELTRAHTVLRTRRRIAGAAPDWALSPGGLTILRGQTGQETSEAMRKEADGKAGAGGNQGAASPEPDGEGGLDGLLAGIDAAIASAQRTLAGAAQTRAAQSVQPTRNPLVHDPDWDEDGRLAQWRSAIGQTHDLPPALAAAIAAAEWDRLEPLAHTPWLGRLLSAALLRARAKTRTHLAGLHAGMRNVPPAQKSKRARANPAAAAPETAALLLHLQAITTAAETGLRDHDRWITAHTLLVRKLNGRRSTSHLPTLIDLVLARPIVSTAMVAAELKVSQRAAQSLIDQLALRELTGRGRYRAWGIV